MYCWEEIIVKGPINFLMKKTNLQQQLALLPSVELALLDFTLAHTVGILTRQEWNGRI